MEREYRKTIIEDILEANALRIASYFDHILKGEAKGEEQIAHLFAITNERLLFYKISHEELKIFWENILKTAYSFREYTKAEEEELQDIFWKIYNNL